MLHIRLFAPLPPLERVPSAWRCGGRRLRDKLWDHFDKTRVHSQTSRRFAVELVVSGRSFVWRCYRSCYALLSLSSSFLGGPASAPLGGDLPRPLLSPAPTASEHLPGDVVVAVGEAAPSLTLAAHPARNRHALWPAIDAVLAFQRATQPASKAGT